MFQRVLDIASEAHQKHRQPHCETALSAALVHVFYTAVFYYTLSHVALLVHWWHRTVV